MGFRAKIPCPPSTSLASFPSHNACRVFGALFFCFFSRRPALYQCWNGASHRKSECNPFTPTRVIGAWPCKEHTTVSRSRESAGAALQVARRAKERAYLELVASRSRWPVELRTTHFRPPVRTLPRSGGAGPFSRSVHLRPRTSLVGHLVHHNRTCLCRQPPWPFPGRHW